MENKATLKSVIGMVVATYDSDELDELTRHLFTLDMSQEEAAEAFCDHFDLGNWIYEALTLNDINISDELDSIRLERQLEEEEGREFREASEEVIRQAHSLGW